MRRKNEKEVVTVKVRMVFTFGETAEPERNRSPERASETAGKTLYLGLGGR